MVSPAPAGMIPQQGLCCMAYCGEPRTRGDDPHIIPSFKMGNSEPRTRGDDPNSTQIKTLTTE